MRKTCLDHIYALAQKDERIVFIGSDLGCGTLAEFRDTIPERFFMEGISEAHVVGMAAGMALEGRIVYVNTIATFLTRRAYEQVCLDLCLHNLPVRLVGNGGGMVYAPLGPTHLAVEDLSIMRALPNMTIVAPADAREMARFMSASVDWPGPIYIRLGKGFDPVVTGDDGPFVIGRGVPMRRGYDVAILTTGVALSHVLGAAAELSASGVEATVIHLPTVKPLDEEAILDACAPVRVVVTVEENTVIGGLGSSVAELLAERGALDGKVFRRMGLPDRFAAQYGSQAQHFAHLGIDAPGVAAMVKKLLETPIRQRPEALAGGPV